MRNKTLAELYLNRWKSGKHLVLYLFDCGVHLIDTSAGGGVWETCTKHPMKHFFKCFKNPKCFFWRDFSSISKSGPRSAAFNIPRMHKDDNKKHEAKCMRMRQKSMRRSRMLFCLIRMHFAECFCHHPSAYHKDDDKNQEAKCMRMRQSRMLFCHIRMHFAE